MRTHQIEASQRLAANIAAAQQRQMQIARDRGAAHAAGQAFVMGPADVDAAEAEALPFEVIALAVGLGGAVPNARMMALRERARAAFAKARCQAEIEATTNMFWASALEELALAEKTESAMARSERALKALREHLATAAVLANRLDAQKRQVFDWAAGRFVPVAGARAVAPGIERFLRLARLNAADIAAIELDVCGGDLALFEAVGAGPARERRAEIRAEIARLREASSLVEIAWRQEDIQAAAAAAVAEAGAGFLARFALWSRKAALAREQGQAFDWAAMAWAPLATRPATPAAIEASLANAAAQLEKARAASPQLAALLAQLG